MREFEFNNGRRKKVSDKDAKILTLLKKGHIVTAKKKRKSTPKSASTDMTKSELAQEVEDQQRKDNEDKDASYMRRDMKADG